MTAPLSAAVPSTTPLAENPVQGLCAVQEKWRAFIAPFHHSLRTAAAAQPHAAAQDTLTAVRTIFRPYSGLWFRL